MDTSQDNDIAQYWAVVPAAGIGKRMNAEIPKQYLNIGVKTVIEYTLNTLLRHPKITGIVVAISPNDQHWELMKFASNKPILTVTGGEHRYQSVLNALHALREIVKSNDWVLVHDAARPCLRSTDVSKMIQELRRDAVGGILAVPVKDTIKQSDSNNIISKTIDRTLLWHAQTPQMFRYGLLCTALTQSMQKKLIVTDEASAIEFCGYQPKLVEGHADNIKITSPEDLEIASYYLSLLTKTNVC